MHGRLLRLRPALIAVGATLALSMTSAAQATGTPQDPERPALTLHEQARTKFQELHERMQKLQAHKQATDPDDSRLLQSGNRLIQERRIHDLMDEARQLIEGGDYDVALERLHKVGEDLNDLLQLLLNRDLELERLMERIKELEEFRDRVDDLLEQQKAEKEAAAEAERLMEHLENIEKAKAAVDALIDQQKQLREETNDAGLSPDAAKTSELAAGEGALKEQTDKVAEQLEKLAKDADNIAKGKEPSEGGENKPDENKPGESEPKEPGEGGGGNGPPSPGGKAGKAAKSASQSMQQAQNKLDDKQPEPSLEDMDKAVKDLEASSQALDEMADEARRQLEQLPFDLQARKQTQTQVDTDRLAKDMESAEQGDENGAGEPTPGKQNVQQAVPKQKAAAGQLKEYKPGKAKQDQQDAADDLENAKNELEDALAQLRQQLEDEVLRALEERFGEMLARQKELSARTLAVDNTRGAQAGGPSTQVPASVRNTCAQLSTGELELSAEASDALKLIEEDGRSAVFPILVEEVREDLDRVAERLGEFRTGGTTQLIQSEIEATLTDLLDALRKTIEDREGGT